jgi:hypothetical protein
VAIAAVVCSVESRATDSNNDAGLSEIVVTAEKYNSTIQNTPISMSGIYPYVSIAFSGVDTTI